MSIDAQTSIEGALLGAIVGDAIGLPYEALSVRRGVRLLGPPDRHRFLVGRGMMSDDGEHASMTGQALCASGLDVARFRRSLAWRLRWWLLGAPAGIGGATLRSILKLWIGIPPTRSGVFSAGNGPAMRSVLIGVAIANDSRMTDLVKASTEITHRDPKALAGAIAVALAGRMSRNDDVRIEEFVRILREILAGREIADFMNRIEAVHASVQKGESTQAFAGRICSHKGVSGYVNETVQIVIHAWQSNPTNFREAVQSVVECGGDTDSVASIVGAIVGARVGAAGIPLEWRTGLLEWPRSTGWVSRLSATLAQVVSQGAAIPPPKVGPLVMLRNLLFLLGIGLHLVRRALPPY